MRVWLAVAIGGALGALARWLVGESILAWSGQATDFPWGTFPLGTFPWGTFPWDTLTVNVVGCALIGFLAPLVITRSPWVAGFVVTGFLGGFTTYSAFAEETFSLADRGDAAGVVLAAIYVLATIATTAAAVALGSRLSSGNQQAVAR